ncbi:MAG: Gfo/Idh/MocA family oxidoreductase [Acidobacteria bacterium]|nr:Gfo/Idh/MocA family oxidoreductase [Acidobacteriota bacterium]
MSTRREFLGAAGMAAAGLRRAAAVQVGRATPAVSTKKIRLGVVGGGFGATFHWHEHPNCVVSAVTDLRADRRDRLRQAYRCDGVHASLQEMLQRARDLDAVAVFSGARDHVKHVRMCFERGLHVVSACPAAGSLEEAEQLRSLKEKTGLRYMMAESSYYRPAAIYARNLFREGGFGELFYTEAEYYHDRGDLEKLVGDRKSRFFEPDGSKSWRWGLPPMHYPTHAVAYVVGVTGERIARVSCLGWGSPHPWTSDNAYRNPYWNESALMQTGKGHMLRCNVFWLAAAGGERAQWFGDKGTLYMQNEGVHPETWKDRMKGKQPLRVPEYWKSDMLPEPMRHPSGHGNSAAFLTAEFINALVEDREPAIDVYESLAMTVPGLVAHQSALRGGEQLRVPRFERKG